MEFFFKILSVCNVNDYKVLDEFRTTKGIQQHLSVQLWVRGSCGENRYIPQGDVNTVVVNIDDIDDFKKTKRLASQPFPGDASIYQITLGSCDCVPYNSLTVTVTESSPPVPDVIKTFVAETTISMKPHGQESRFI